MRRAGARRLLSGLAGLAGLALVAGCAVAPAPADPPPRPAPKPVVGPPSAASQEMAQHLARVQSSLLTQGLLRRDGGGPDARFSADTLARNFMAIALFQEYTEAGGRLVARPSASALHRWGVPIRYRVSFGASVDAGKRRNDAREITRFAARLARLTGLPFSESATTSGANAHIFIVNEDERRALGPTLRAIEPGISRAALSAAVDMPRDTYCLAFASDPNDDFLYDRAIIIIRAEHPDLLRVSCIHEEMAQSMGLANDSPRARPSIFNDDEEFALLTGHDELLLRILYDPRLRPGMREAEARPIVNEIAAELMGGDV